MFSSPTSQTPACHCLLKSPSDAIYILEAVRQGLLPRCSRRLTGNERSRIGPGSVWVWEEEETNMRRWTDGRRWGASRVGAGGFLIYREVEGSGRGRHSTSPSISPPPARNGMNNARQHHHPLAGQPYPDYPAHPSMQQHPLGVAHVNGGNGFPDPSGSGRRRHNGLVKQTYSTTMHTPDSGQMKKFHVVAYYSKNEAAQDPLPRPHEIPQIAGLTIPPGIWADYQDPRRGDDPSPSSAAPSAAPSQARPPPSASYPMPQLAAPLNRSPYLHHPPGTSPAPYPPQGPGPPPMMHPGYGFPPPQYYHPPPLPPPPPPPGHEQQMPPGSHMPQQQHQQQQQQSPLGHPMYPMPPYYHMDPYYRYQPGPPPGHLAPEQNAAYDQSRAPPPPQQPITPQQSQQQYQMDRRTSVAPSKRNMPKHVHSSSPYPQGPPNPVGRHIGVIDPSLSLPPNLTNERAPGMPLHMASPYPLPPPNGNGRSSTPVVYEPAEPWHRDYQQPPSRPEDQQDQQKAKIESQGQHGFPTYDYHPGPPPPPAVVEERPQQTQMQTPTLIHPTEDVEKPSLRVQDAQSHSPARLRSPTIYPAGGSSRTPDSPGGHSRLPSASMTGNQNGAPATAVADLTLPPIRSAEEKDGWMQHSNGHADNGAAPTETDSKSQSYASPPSPPRKAVENDRSPTSKPQCDQLGDVGGGAEDVSDGGSVGKRIHGEDARQLRELGKMVTL